MLVVVRPRTDIWAPAFILKKEAKSFSFKRFECFYITFAFCTMCVHLRLSLKCKWIGVTILIMRVYS